MKEIEEFKKQNGGVISYSTKELLASIHIKLDRIEHRLIEGDKAFSRIDTTLKWHFKAISALYGLITLFLIKPVKYIINLIRGG